MSRFINALLIFLMVLSAAAVYDMKYEAEIAAADVARLEREIDQQRAAISVLKAEWSMLSQPDRLQQLVERHASVLQLEPLAAGHFGTLADVPPKPVEVDPAATPDVETVPPPQRAAAAAPAVIPSETADPLDDLIGDGDVMVR